MICANKLSTAIEIMDRIRLAYEYLPRFLKPGITVYNKAEISFSNMSSIKACSTSSSAARGSSCNVLIVDEMSFIPKQIINEFFASVMPIISSASNSKAIIVSTPNGTDNLYYDLWKEAKDNKRLGKKEGWQPFEILWNCVPNRTEEWKEQQIATIGIERWRQEFQCEFLQSSTIKKLIPDDIIDKYKEKISLNQSKNINKGKDMVIFSQDGTLQFKVTIYHEFNPNRTYLISSDISEGIGKDSSVLYVWDVTDTSNIIMCAKYSDNKTSILDFAFVTFEICKLYGNPFLACECNGISLGYVEQLRRTHGYENFVRLNRDNGCGIQSHVQVKSRACLWARDMMTTVGFGFELNDLDLIDEMSTFVKKDTKSQNVFAAFGDNHDDHIMTFIWALWILSPDIIEKYFVVADRFRDAIGNTYPRNVQPLFEYEEYQIKEIMNSPIYKEFMTYKEAHPEYVSNIYSDTEEQMRLLQANTIVKDGTSRRSMSQEEMLRQYRGDSSPYGNTTIFGTGGTLRSPSVFQWDDDNGLMW